METGGLLQILKHSEKCADIVICLDVHVTPALWFLTGCYLMFTCSASSRICLLIFFPNYDSSLACLFVCVPVVLVH